VCRAQLTTDQDWRFGFYNGGARSWDQIAVNAPYYLIVKSSGNDRSDSGQGHPSDGPFDCISTSGNAKNILTVGAVRKINGGYSQPIDVEMSSFSSWGPTDDGRIKPDIVGAGVAIRSTVSSGDGAYSSMQGTSMSAPNVTGALVLVQEAYHNLNNNYMRASTLKALALHTAYEAGNFDGPDYRNGWGLMNTKGAVEVILNEDGVNEQIIEASVANGQEYILELNPVSNQKITATLVWTDVPGNSPAQSLDPPNLMLVNDLDMRIVDEAENEQFPWILDPAFPSNAAARGDNFRDNVEKIEFDNPEPRKYFVKIKPKGSINGGVQNFSLIISYKSEDNSLSNLYWIGNTGNWSNGSNWSLTSGGPAANFTPSADFKVVFDENSFAGSGNVSNMDGDFEVGGVIWFANDPATIDLMSNSLTVRGNVLMGRKAASVNNGNMNFISEGNEREWFIDMVDVNSSNLNVSLTTDGNSSWEIKDGGFNIDNLDIASGNVRIIEGELGLKNINIDVAATSNVTLFNVIANNLETISISGDVNFSDNGCSYNFNPATVNSVTSSSITYGSMMNASTGNLLLDGADNTYYNVSIDGAELEIINNNSIGTIDMSNASTLRLHDGSIINITEDFIINNNTETANVIAEVEAVNAVLNFVTHKKFCFENLMVENVDVEGNSSVNAGTTSTVINSLSWFETTCDNLLFADFSYENDCAFAYTVLTDQSSGGVVSRKWIIDGEEQSNEVVYGYNFMGAGDFPVTLEIENGDGDILSYSGVVTCVESTFDTPNEIIQNATQLVSKNLCDSYQWYKGFAEVEGATERIYEYNGVEDVYFVVCADSVCTQQSEVLDLRSNPTNETFINELVKIYPNPVVSELFVEFLEQPETNFEIILVNQVGATIKRVNSNNQSLHRINLVDFPSGFYTILLINGNSTYSSKLVKF
jgi:hypothetical protein